MAETQSYPHYEYYSCQQGGSNAIKILALFLVGLIIGVAIGYFFQAGQTSSLQQKVSTLEEKVKSLEDSLSQKEKEYEKLLSEKDELQQKYNELKKNYDTLLLNYTQLKQEYAKIQEDYKKLLEEQRTQEEGVNETLNQLYEVLYYRIFSLYDYKTRSYYYAYYRVWAFDYLSYRLNPNIHTYASLENRFTADYIRQAVLSYKEPESAAIQEIAYDLYQISGGDPELFANLALQLVHQIYYNVTGYTKYPVETLVEGSGDCDNVAVLLASILAAGGLDTLVLLVEVETPQGVGGHAMVAVALPSPPDDLFQYGRDTYYYYEYNGKKFYLMEATWMTPDSPDYISPYLPESLYVPGALVGDNPWGDSINVVEVVYIPGG